MFRRHPCRRRQTVRKRGSNVNRFGHVGTEGQPPTTFRAVLRRPAYGVIPRASMPCCPRRLAAWQFLHLSLWLSSLVIQASFALVRRRYRHRSRRLVIQAVLPLDSWLAVRPSTHRLVASLPIPMPSGKGRRFASLTLHSGHRSFTRGSNVVCFGCVRQWFKPHSCWSASMACVPGASMPRRPIPRRSSMLAVPSANPAWARLANSLSLAGEARTVASLPSVVLAGVLPVVGDGIHAVAVIGYRR